MIQVKYTGKDPLDHRSGAWKPGETKMMGRAVAFALVRERGDMEIVESVVKFKPKTPQPKKDKAERKKGVDDNG
jgi:hypothetical protein